MSEGPDTRWQELIENYLNKLHVWQKVTLKNPNLTFSCLTERQQKKVDDIYKDMKKAEKELRDYEASKGY